MTAKKSQVTTEFLQAFADAWNEHDVDKLMTFMTDEPVYIASAGPDVDGARFSGATAVRDAFAQVFEIFPDAQWDEGRHFVSGDRGVSEWKFRGTLADGKKVEVEGCDIFTFDGDRIAVKNAYRKQRPPSG